MSLSIRVAHGEQNNLVSLSGKKDEQTNKSSGKSIFAGNLKQNFDISSIIEDMKQQQVDKFSEIQQYKTYLEDIEKSKSTLQEEFGVDSESQEQKDLELLQKFQNYKNGSDFPEFSKEEIKRLEELQHISRTDYQNRVLELNNIAGEMNKNISEGEQIIARLTESITDAMIAQLKSQAMIKANTAADEIMDTVGKEIISTLVEEGKENIDEKIEEEQKKADESAEKQEERDKQIQDAKEKRKEQEELIRGDMEADQLDIDSTMQKRLSKNMADVQVKIQRILKENNLINEDLIGIEIDFNF